MSLKPGGKVVLNRNRLFMGEDSVFLKKYRPGKNPARLKVTTKSKPAYEKKFDLLFEL